MVKMQKIEDEAKAIVAEAESVTSGILGAIAPRWTKFVEAWKSWSTRKKSIAAVVIVAATVCAYQFGIDATRLVMGGYRSAYSYGHGTNVTPDQVSDLSRRLDTLEAENHRLDADNSQMRIELNAVEDNLSDANKKPAKITTGSITRHKKSR